MKASQLANQENVGVPSVNVKKVKGRSGKRSVSEMSPAKAPVTRKRTAFGDITNVRKHSPPHFSFPIFKSCQFNPALTDFIFRPLS